MVHFPEGATVLGAAVKWSSRSAVDLSAHISNAGSAVTIDFAFLDVDDGGIIEILYQGDSEQSPTLTGSIMGAPKGIQTIPRMKLTYGDGRKMTMMKKKGTAGGAGLYRRPCWL